MGCFWEISLSGLIPVPETNVVGYENANLTQLSHAWYLDVQGKSFKDTCEAKDCASYALLTAWSGSMLIERLFSQLFS